MRTDHLTIGGLRTRVLSAGPSDADEGVLCIHGNPGSADDWRDLVARIGRFARAVALDLPGFGEADKPRDLGCRVGDFAEFVERARVALGLRRVHLLVHDFGGPFGFEWAARHPDDLASIVIVNAPPMRDYHWYPLAKVWRTRGAGELLHATLNPPAFRWLVGRGNPQGLPDKAVERMRRHYDRGTQRTVLRLYRSTPAERMTDADPAVLAAHRRPALVVWGTRDIYIPTRFAYRHREAFPQARIVTLPDSGHFALLDDPDAVAEHVVPFVAAQVVAR